MNKPQALGIAACLAIPCCMPSYEDAPAIEKSQVHKLEERALDPFLVEEEANIAMADTQEPIGGCTRIIEVIRDTMYQMYQYLDSKLPNDPSCFKSSLQLRNALSVLRNKDYCPPTTQQTLQERVSTGLQAFKTSCGQPYDSSNSAK